MRVPAAPTATQEAPCLASGRADVSQQCRRLRPVPPQHAAAAAHYDLLDGYRTWRCLAGFPSSKARRRSQALGAARHAGLEAPQREETRLTAQPAAVRRDDVAAAERSRVEPGRVDVPQTREEALILLEQLQQDTAQWGTEEGINLVAFGGGVASTLAAFLVHSVFEARSVAVFGVSRRTTEGQLQRARTLAECLGIELWELPTADDGVSVHVSVGETEATRHPELAATVAAVAGWLAAPEFDGATVVLFDGRHAEDLAGFDWPEYRRESWWDGSEDSGDLLSPARAMALESWDVTPAAVSPPQPAEEKALRVSLLARLPEVAVRAVAKEAGIPNWDWIDPRYSYDMEFAEPVSSGFPVASVLPEAQERISEVLDLGDNDSVRLRVDRANGSVIEVEESLLPRARDLHQQLEAHLRGLGLPPVSVEPARHGNGRSGSSTDREAAALSGQPPASVEPARHSNRSDHWVEGSSAGP